MQTTEQILNESTNHGIDQHESCVLTNGDILVSWVYGPDTMAQIYDKNGNKKRLETKINHDPWCELRDVAPLTTLGELRDGFAVCYLNRFRTITVKKITNSDLRICFN